MNKFTPAQVEVLKQVETMWGWDGKPEAGTEVYSVACKRLKTLDALVKSGIAKEYTVMSPTDTGCEQAALTVDLPKFQESLKRNWRYPNASPSR